MRQIARRNITRVVVLQFGVPHHAGITAMTIRAAQLHRRSDMHGGRIGAHMARAAASGLGQHIGVSLARRCRRRGYASVIARNRLLAFCRTDRAERQGSRKKHPREQEQDMAQLQHQ